MYDTRDLAPDVDAATADSHTETLGIGPPDPLLRVGLACGGARVVRIVTDEGGTPTAGKDIPFVRVVRRRCDMRAGQRCRDRGGHLEIIPDIVAVLRIERPAGALGANGRDLGARERRLVRLERGCLWTGRSGGIRLRALGGEEAEGGGPWAGRFGGIGITTGSLIADTTIMFSLFACDLGKFRREGIKGSDRRTGSPAADDSSGLRPRTRCQISLRNPTESFERCRAKAEATTTVRVRVVHDFRECHRGLDYIGTGHTGIEDETAASAASVTGGVAGRVVRRQWLRVPLKSNATLHLQQLEIVVGCALAGTLTRIVRMEVGIRL